MKLAAFLLLASCAGAVDLHIPFGVLERILGEQVFTQEGRRYLKGDPNTRCNFAYLESPRIEGDGGRLRIHARFTGRSALNVFGQCVGLGDAFPVVITARPIYGDGQLRLRDVVAASDGRTGIYIRRVCAALSNSLARDFRYPLEAEARKLLEDGGKREVHRFDAPEVRVGQDALVLVLDFDLWVK